MDWHLNPGAPYLEVGPGYLGTTRTPFCLPQSVTCSMNDTRRLGLSGAASAGLTARGSGWLASAGSTSNDHAMAQRDVLPWQGVQVWVFHKQRLHQVVTPYERVEVS